jgi:hypothetical protein
MRFILVIVAIAGLSVPALAQTQRLPRTSPAEQEVRDINRTLQRQNRSLNYQQQDQFEVNQLRQDLQRQRTFPPIVGPGPLGRICAPGQVVC